MEIKKNSKRRLGKKANGEGASSDTLGGGGRSHTGLWGSQCGVAFA